MKIYLNILITIIGILLGAVLTSFFIHHEKQQKILLTGKLYSGNDVHFTAGDFSIDNGGTFIDQDDATKEVSVFNAGKRILFLTDDYYVIGETQATYDAGVMRKTFNQIFNTIAELQQQESDDSAKRVNEYVDQLVTCRANALQLTNKQKGTKCH